MRLHLASLLVVLCGLPLMGQTLPTQEGIRVVKEKSYKRGSTLELTWTAGSTTDRVTIELLQDTVVNTMAKDTLNVKRYAWDIPPKMKTGDNYQIRVVRTGTTDILFITDRFAIKRKVPLLLILVPAVAVVGTTVAIAGGSGGSSSSNDLPMPVKPN